MIQKKIGPENKIQSQVQRGTALHGVVKLLDPPTLAQPDTMFVLALIVLDGNIRHHVRGQRIGGDFHNRVGD